MLKKYMCGLMLLASFSSVAQNHTAEENSTNATSQNKQETVKNAFIHSKLMKPEDWTTDSNGTVSALVYTKPVTANYKLSSKAFTIVLKQDPSEFYNYLTLNTASRCYQAATTYISQGWGNGQQLPTGDAQLILNELVSLQDTEQDLHNTIHLSQGTFSVDVTGGQASCELNLK